MEREGLEPAVSTESIDRYVYSPAGRCAGLSRLLSQRKAKRSRRRRNGAREPAIPSRMPIHLRPTKAHLRSEFGHWEGDLMHFRTQCDILLTLHERRSRLTLAQRLLSKTRR
jgi:transposase, IS30 family